MIVAISSFMVIGKWLFLILQKLLLRFISWVLNLYLKSYIMIVYFFLSAPCRSSDACLSISPTHTYPCTCVHKHNAQPRDKNEMVLTPNHSISKVRYTDILKGSDGRDSKQMMRWHFGCFQESNIPGMFKVSQFLILLILLPPFELTLPFLSIF